MKVNTQLPIIPPQSLDHSEERYRLLIEGIADYAIILLDPHGIISSWNLGACKIKGFTADEAVGQYFACSHPEENLRSGDPERQLLKAKTSGRSEDEGWRVRKDGSRFWASVLLTALYDAKGEVWGYAEITRDITDRRVCEEALRQSEEHFRLMVEGVKDCAIFLLNPQGFVTSWNSGAEKVTGYTADDIVGRHISLFYTTESVTNGAPAQELEVARVESSFEDEGWRLRKDGSRFWAHVLINALYDAEGRIYGYATFTRDMSARQRIHALELAEQRTNEFLAMLSHELRNPLAPMRSALQVMQSTPADHPDQSRSRSIIERQVDHIARLIDDLVDVSRVTAGNIRLSLETVDLQEVVARAVEVAHAAIDERQHHFDQQLPDAPVFVRGDLLRLTQVLLNLLDNAAQYTPTQGTIGLRLETDAEVARIRVTDTGEGLSQPMLHNVFDLFVQGERGLDRASGGLGIGLTLARRLVEMQGGTITATSDGPNRGSEFVVELPLASAAASTPGTSAHSKTDSALDNDDQPTSRPLQIVLVEDMADVAEGMEMILQLWGYQVTVVADGQEGLETVRHLTPDVVLLDIGLPRMNGYEVAEQLRADPQTRDITLIALTGYGQKKDRERAFSAGFDHHLVKGDSLDRLEQLLNEQVRKS